MYNIHIQDSHKVSKLKFGDILEKRFRKAVDDGNEEEFVVFSNRSRFSLKMEWTVHNFLYTIHVRREQTKDVDLDFPCDKPEWLYCILGLIVWIFIK